MKRQFTYLLLAITLIIAGCSESFDDSKIWDKLDDHENRIVKLEELCKQMNANISSLQTIVTALQNNDYITGVTPITQNGETIGYTITFSKSESITIYHGKNGEDGKDGQNGKDGVDGKDGYTPQIGVKKDSDGLYYWTLDGQWLLDANGDKIKAQGTDGKDGADGAPGADGEDGKDGINGTDGANGKDGVTPQLKIEDGYWFVSYDNGGSWTKLGKATGEDGKDGENGANGADGAAGADGDSFFKEVVVEGQSVRFVFADGSEVEIPLSAQGAVSNLQSIAYIPKYSDGKATVNVISESSRVVEMDFELSPISAAAEVAANWSTLVNMKAVYTATRAVELVEMPILSCKADSATGVITVAASAANLSEEFIAGTQSASARLAISGENFNIVSDYIPLVAQVIVQPDNEIWYSSTDGKAVTPKVAMVTRSSGNVENIFDSTTNMWVLRYESAVVEIPQDAFSGCKTLATISLPNSVTKIGSSAFKNCTGLTGTFVIPESVTEIGEQAFYKCNAITSFESSFASEDGRSLIVNDALVAVAQGNLIEHTIPAGVTTIEASAYESCKTLTAVTIPEGVESIGKNAFGWCSNLQRVTLPKSLTSIGESAFNGCSLLASIDIPEGVTEIGASAFASCKSLKSVVIPNNLASINKMTFSFCNALGSVTIGSNVTTICQQAFYSCGALAEITIPDSVKSIEKQAFRNCKSLTAVTLGAGVESFGESVFEGCAKLETISLPENTTTIGNRMFYQCTALKSITIPKNVNLIPEMAFSDCESLSSITLEGKDIEIGSSAFESCAFTELNIFDNVAIIGENAFKYCESLTSAVISANVKSIGESAFNSSALESVTLSEGITSIGDFAFASTQLTEIVIPSSVISIGNSAFQTAPLKKVTLNEGLQTIGNSAFIQFKATEITIPSTVTSIGSSAFSYCTSLVTINCKPTTPPTIGSGAFAGNVTGRKLYVPVGSGEAYKSANVWKNYSSYIEEKQF